MKKLKEGKAQYKEILEEDNINMIAKMHGMYMKVYH